MAKPRFDPNAPFEVADKPKFDPTQPFTEVSEPAPEPTFEQEHPTLAKIANTAKEAGKATVNALPMIGGVAGGILGTPADAIVGPVGNMVGAGIGGYLGTAAKNVINRVIDPENAPQTMGKVMLEPVVEGTRQGLAQGVGEAIAPYLNQAAEHFAQGSKVQADKLLSKATGATGAQASKFPEGALDELRKPRPELGGKKIVNFGSSPGDIAENAQKVMDAAEASKDQIVNERLGSTPVDRNKVYNFIRSKIAGLADNESQIGLKNALESKLDDIVSMADRTSPEVPFPKAEEIRKGFDDVAKWGKNTDAVGAEANKIAANAYRRANEETALSADPSLGEAFKAAKTTQHNLIPVRDAAEKRALTLNQSPMGGLLSHTAGGVGAGVGGLVGGPIGAVVGFGAGLGAKALRPRFASMAATTADAIADALSSNPEAFGQWAPVLAQAAARGPKSLDATDAILQKLDPGYVEQRDMILSKSRANRNPAMEGR